MKERRKSKNKENGVAGPRLKKPEEEKEHSLKTGHSFHR